MIAALPCLLPRLRAQPSARQAAAALAKYTDTIPNTKVTFDMVPIPAGTFVMGSPASEPGRNADEGPQHKVTLKAFYIGAKEVTWAEYDEFAFSIDLQRKRKLGLTGPKDAGDVVSRPTPPYADESWGWGKDAQPVIGITHYSATKYCEWLSARTGKKYRLPTEAEWEYAARAGTTTAYSFGDDAASVADYAWLKANSEEQPHVGGQKKPNAWGLFDVHGNAAEWTRDLYDAGVLRQVAGRQPGQRHQGAVPARGARRVVGRRAGAGCEVRPGGRRLRPGAGATPRTPRASGGTPMPRLWASASSRNRDRLSDHLIVYGRSLKFGPACYLRSLP